MFSVAGFVVWACKVSLNFLEFSKRNQIPMLMKATSDDDNPTSGYMYQEITSILLTKLN